MTADQRCICGRLAGQWVNQGPWPCPMHPPIAAARGHDDTHAALREAIRDELAGWPLGGGYYQYSVLVDEAAEMTDALLAGPLAGLLADRERVQRVRDAVDEVTAYAKGITDQLTMPTASYGPSEWRLHGDARGHRLAIAEVRRALDGGQP